MLVRFLQATPFDTQTTWYHHIMKPVSLKNFLPLAQMLRYLMLRRTKASHLPDLPPISHHTVLCQLNTKAQEIYNAEYDRFITLFGTDSNIPFDASTYFKMLSNLRMSCNHPLLFRSMGDFAGLTDKPLNKMERHLGVFVPEENRVNLKSNARTAYEEDWQLSSKLQYLIQRLTERSQACKPGECCLKTVVYTQWRGFMDW